ncbi:MAG: hypothetical protein JNL38_12720, partial [Myxococcales bacterium]|nr:hypothetical protein [Myxococcales bacterium]
MCTSAARRLLSRLSLGVLALGVVGACASAPLRQDTPHAGASDAGVEGAAAEATTEDGGAEDAGDDAAPDAEADAAVAQADPVGPCPKHMVLVDGRFCIDRFEASLVEVAADGSEKPYPHYLPVDGHDVRAVSEPGVFPQAFISEVQADDACQASGKRLCTFDEWKTACMGPQKTTFPYGAQRAAAGTCHDAGKSPVAAVFGAAALASVAPAPRSTGAPAPRSTGAPAPRS